MTGEEKNIIADNTGLDDIKYHTYNGTVDIINIHSTDNRII